MNHLKRLSQLASDLVAYGLLNAPYDRILSIGALEHVKPKELKKVYQKIYDALAPGGLAVHQFFSFEREPYPVSGVLIQLFFPGSLLVLHRHHLEVAETVLQMVEAQMKIQRLYQNPRQHSDLCLYCYF